MSNDVCVFFSKHPPHTIPWTVRRKNHGVFDPFSFFFNPVVWGFLVVLCRGVCVQFAQGSDSLIYKHVSTQPRPTSLKWPRPRRQGRPIRASVLPILKIYGSVPITGGVTGVFLDPYTISLPSNKHPKGVTSTNSRKYDSSLRLPFSII